MSETGASISENGGDSLKTQLKPRLHFIVVCNAYASPQATAAPNLNICNHYYFSENLIQPVIPGYDYSNIALVHGKIAPCHGLTHQPIKQ